MTEKAQETPVSVTITVTLPSVLLDEATALYQGLKNSPLVKEGGRVSMRVDEPNQRRMLPLTRVP